MVERIPVFLSNCSDFCTDLWKLRPVSRGNLAGIRRRFSPLNPSSAGRYARGVLYI